MSLNDKLFFWCYLFKFYSSLRFISLVIKVETANRMNSMKDSSFHATSLDFYCNNVFIRPFVDLQKGSGFIHKWYVSGRIFNPHHCTVERV